MKKYTIDYGFGKAILYTPYKHPDKRFGTLASTCFGIRKSIMCIVIVGSEDVELPDGTEWNERLEFNGDVYIWREDGSRKMIEPGWAADDDWDCGWAKDVRYISEKMEDE